MKSGRLSWILLLLAAGVLVACHLLWMELLPERVATHFDAAGKANGWMSRAQFGWESALVHLGVAAFLVGLISVMHRLPSGLVNLPNKEYWLTPERYPEVCAFMRGWSRWLAAAILVWGTLMNWQLVLANQVVPPRLDSMAVWILSGCLLAAVGAAVIWLVVKFARRVG
jgi:uncharacterized membrane protein